jgi:hypothetical protein
MHRIVEGGEFGALVMASSDILLSAAEESTKGGDRSLLVALVPITVALLGVGLVIFGGVSAKGPAAATAATATLDPTTTGSIAMPDDRRRALELLDP